MGEAADGSPPPPCPAPPHRAITNSSRTMRLPSPMYFCTSSLPDTRMKVQSVWCATARASSVCAEEKRGGVGSAAAEAKGEAHVRLPSGRRPLAWARGQPPCCWAHLASAGWTVEQHTLRHGEAR
jgi:hypothetical protein